MHILRGAKLQKRYEHVVAFVFSALLVASNSKVRADSGIESTRKSRGSFGSDHEIEARFEASCDPSVYYKPVESSLSRETLQTLLETTHRNTLPYTDSDSDDVWKALQDLDRGTDGLDGSPTVRLIYSRKDVPAEPKGTGDTWNREHVWPKSRGVGKSGPDFTDVHHLFPADWGINSIRSNRFFDVCNSPVDCKTPTELNGFDDAPEYGGDIFQPPLEIRGDIARAILYMDLRYPHLEVTDDPKEANQMGYLSTLLAWHKIDPPTEAEKIRNNRACSRWQGNRNPFVDFPDLAQVLYSSTEQAQTCDRLGLGEHYESGLESICYGINNKSQSIGPGDVMVVGIYADNPDLVALLSLVDLPAGIMVHITDNAHDGKNFKSNEGVISLLIPKTIPAGTVFGYGEGLLYGSSWKSEVDKGFALSTSGDTIVIYSTSSTEADTNEITFLSAASFAGGKFTTEPGAKYGTTTSVIPDSISNFSVFLGGADNYVYNGPTRDTKRLLQKHLVDKNNWKGSNSKNNLSVERSITLQRDSFVLT